MLEMTGRRIICAQDFLADQAIDKIGPQLASPNEVECFERLGQMKKLSLCLTAMVGLTVCLEAGEAVAYKQTTSPSPELYGTGFYGALDGGANLFQNRGETRTFTEGDGLILTDTLKIHPDNDVGIFGGMKLGYVFGTGIIRPTIEGDFFYNGFRAGSDFSVREIFDPCHGIPGCEAPILQLTRHGNASTWINSGAFMGNFILRFAFGRFQPYAGAGVGAYYAESTDIDIHTPIHEVHVSGENHTDFAWQVLGGSDYYWNPKLSTFIEYRYLNYTSSQVDTGDDRDLGQHLLGAGLRLHF
jgi:opacity protein-like surface antigen